MQAVECNRECRDIVELEDVIRGTVRIIIRIVIVTESCYPFTKIHFSVIQEC